MLDMISRPVGHALPMNSYGLVASFAANLGAVSNLCNFALDPSLLAPTVDHEPNKDCAFVDFVFHFSPPVLIRSNFVI